MFVIGLFLVGKPAQTSRLEMLVAAGFAKLATSSEAVIAKAPKAAKILPVKSLVVVMLRLLMFGSERGFVRCPNLSRKRARI